jgi:phosphoserine phosphatase
MDGETINILASAVGASEEVSAITKRAMAGELDFYESLTARVKFLKGLPLAKAEEIVSNLNYIAGAAEIITYLKSKNIATVVFSGGFHIATDRAQKLLKFDLNFANELHHKNGILSGSVGGEMMFGDSKGKMLARLKSFLNLNQNEVACVGDGANDVSMFREAGVCVAFCANPILKAAATHVVDTRDLRELKQIL